MQQGGCCLSRDSPVAVQCLSRGVCCSVGTQPCVFSSCVLLCWPPKACWCQWKGILLISSAVCCFDRMPFINKCHVQLLFVNTELCLRGAVQKAERRIVIDAKFMAWLYSYNRDHRVCFDVCFYSLPLPHPLAQIDKKKMDWIDIHPVWGGISSSPSILSPVSNNLCMRSNLLLPWCTNCRESTWQGEKTLWWCLSFLQRALPPAFLYAADIEEVVLCASHFLVTFNDCFRRKIILFLNVCPELLLTAVPGASL